jgi:hypothetical protein
VAEATGITATGVQPRPIPRTLPTRQAKVFERQRVVKQVLSAIDRVTPGARAGFEVVDRRSGRAVGFAEDEQFFSASLVKLLIAIDALDRHGTTDPSFVAEIRYMLSYSDDQTASRLWVDDGGPDIVTRTAARIGLHDTRPPEVTTQWGATLLSAADVVRIYQYVLTRLPRPQRAVILGALRDAHAVASDGTYQFFGIPDGLRGLPSAVKQGWTAYGSWRELHSTGLVGPGDRYIVVLLTADPIQTPEATCAAALTAGARALGPVLR